MTAHRLRLADAVVADTHQLVELTSRCAWSEVPAQLARRRARLVDLERSLQWAGPEAVAEGRATLAALHAAVLESERLMVWLLPREQGRPH